MRRAVILVAGLMVGCAAVDDGMVARPTALQVAAPNPFAGLTIKAITALPVMCPCFDLIAVAPGKDIKISYERSFPSQPTNLEVNGRELERSDWFDVGRALRDATGVPADRQQDVQELAEFLMVHGEAFRP